MDKRPCSQEGGMDYEEEKAHLRKKIRGPADCSPSIGFAEGAQIMPS